MPAVLVSGRCRPTGTATSEGSTVDPYAQYRQQAATTASPAQLVLMLFDGALSEVARATRALDAAPADLAEVNDCLGRAQAIVSHLSMTLDRERGGQVAAGLSSLYRFCQERLVEANVHKTSGPLPAVTDTLAGLRDAWEQACVNTSEATLAAVPG
jgi:flagellar secretion chaperone FliS